MNHFDWPISQKKNFDHEQPCLIEKGGLGQGSGSSFVVFPALQEWLIGHGYMYTI
jgi:hypothetical protein